MNLQKFNRKRKSFENWLAGCGAELLAPTNEYELLRFRGSKGTSIVYRKATEEITMTGQAREAWQCFTSARPWRGNPPAKRRKVSRTTVKAIRERDGDLCFLCQEKVTIIDETIDHLVPITSGGPSHIANYVLMHKSCNCRAGHMSAAEKIKAHVKTATQPKGQLAA